MTRISIAALIVSTASFASSCSGSETGNPATPDATLSHFEASGCKTRETDAGTALGSSQSALVAASDYDGLECVEWETTAAGLTVRLLNFQGGCGVTWGGRASRRADGSIDLVLDNTTCFVARCGSCLYDAQFDLSGVSSASPLALHVGFASCADGGGTTPAYDKLLPLDSAASGIACRYAGLSSVLSPSKCAQKNLQCGGGLCPMPCAGNLMCTPVGEGDSRCLLPCTGDGDCLPAGTATCQDGVCKVNASF
jgi:hypothetical protein